MAYAAALATPIRAPKVVRGAPDARARRGSWIASERTRACALPWTRRCSVAMRRQLPAHARIDGTRYPNSRASAPCVGAKRRGTQQPGSGRDRQPAGRWVAGGRELPNWS